MKGFALAGSGTLSRWLLFGEWRAHPVRAVLPAGWNAGEGAWFGAGDWPRLGLPSPVRRFLEAV